MTSSTDVCGKVMGEWGWWQCRAVMVIFLVKIPSAWFMACIIFTAPAPNHGEFWCQPPTNVVVSNASHWIKISHPIKDVGDQEFAIDFCNVYDDVRDHATVYANLSLSLTEPKFVSPRNTNVVPCDKFEHHPGYQSLVTDFDLVCSRDILVAVTQFFHLFGILLGGVVASKLIDSFSPRRVMIVGMLSQIGCGILTGTVTIFEIHIFFRFMSAMSCALMFTGGSTIFGDITGGRMKTVVVTSFEQFWSVGVIMLPGLASFFNSWSHLYMAISIPTILIIILMIWVPDAPRWLVNKGYVQEAKVYLEECAKVNNTSLPNDLDTQLHAQAAAALQMEPPAGWCSLFKGYRATRTVIAFHVAWAIIIVVYYGTLLNIRSFGREHLFINTIIAGLSELLGTTIGLFLILYSKNKWLWTSLFTIIGGAVPCLSWLYPKSLTGNWQVAALMLIAMFSKTSISCSLALLTTCTIDFVPPNKRKIAMFSSLAFARFWLLGAPFVGVLAIFGIPVSLSAFGVLTVIAGFTTLVLTTNPMEVPVEPEVPQQKLSIMDPNNTAIWTIPMDADKTRL